MKLDFYQYPMSKQTDSSDVQFNEEADEYVWINLEKIENYNLGEFVKELLLKLRNKKELKNNAEIFYNY